MEALKWVNHDWASGVWSLPGCHACAWHRVSTRSLISPSSWWTAAVWQFPTSLPSLCLQLSTGLILLFYSLVMRSRVSSRSSTQASSSSSWTVVPYTVPPYTVPRGGQRQVGGSCHSQTRDVGSSDVGWSQGWGTAATHGRQAVAGKLSTGRRHQAAHPSMADKDSNEGPSSDFTPQPTGEDSSHVGEGGPSSDATPQPTGEDINHVSMDRLLAIIILYGLRCRRHLACHQQDHYHSSAVQPC